ncbi:MAG: glycosyltransferase family 2 protein, partial [candidate division Zixibacteria bacterium]|nr:glycosyltransferase family 2 protein [candidate division Zixibacteria bacterium]
DQWPTGEILHDILMNCPALTGQKDACLKDDNRSILKIMSTVLVIIPAFNAADSIAELIEKILQQPADLDIAVIDDGSTDNTGEIARGCAVTCLDHQRNRGKGAALCTGFAYALSNDYEAVITMDADLQHDPLEINRFLQAGGDAAAIIIGTRRRGGAMPRSRRISNLLVSFICSLLAATKLTDSQSGYRLIPTRVLKELPLDSLHYELELELLIKAARAGVPIREIPIETIYGQGRSFIRPFRDTIRFLKLALKSLFW